MGEKNRKYLKAEGLLKIAQALVVSGTHTSKHAANALHLCNLRADKYYSSTGLSHLQIAAECGDTVMVDILMHLGADVNRPTCRCASTPLMLAASHGHTDTVELLLHNGAQPNLCDAWNNSPLYKACCYNYIQCVKLLLKQGANPNHGNKWGALPLQYAVRSGYKEVVQLLLDHGADPCLPGEVDMPPPLSLATRNGDLDMVELLLKHGADVNYCCKSNGRTCLYHCMDGLIERESGHQLRFAAIIQTLLQAGAEITMPCLNVIRGTHEKECHLILQNLPYTAQLHHEGLISIWQRCPQWFDQLYEAGMNVILKDRRMFDSKACLQPMLIEQVARTPRSLQSLCKLEIRSHLKPNVSVGINKLPLAEHIRGYVSS